jgi:putative PIN family toxin of toxin-antitoxin system
MLKLVIDTNVVISSLLKAESNPALIMSLIFRGDCTLCVTEKIFVEYEEVSGRGKFKKLDQAGVGKLLSALRKRACGSSRRLLSVM